VVGRRTTYGAPFFSLGELQVGDVISTTTVQGTATYTVTSVEVSDARDPFARSTDNILTLLTGNPPGVALDQLVVVAELEGKPFQPTPQNARTFANPLAPGMGHWAQFVVWALALALALAASFAAWQRDVPRVVLWVLAVPTVSACLLLFARSVNYLLPSVL
jgi:sortase A